MTAPTNFEASATKGKNNPPLVVAAPSFPIPPSPPPLGQANLPPGGVGDNYVFDQDGMHLLVPSKNRGGFGNPCGVAASQKKMLANFTAIITEETTLYRPGGGKEILYTIRVEHNGKITVIVVPANEFSHENWWSKRIGSSAIVAVMHNAQEHIRNAIQQASCPVLIDAHEKIGWVEVNGTHYYLHAAGVIGPPGAPLNYHRDTAGKATTPTGKGVSPASGTIGTGGTLLRAKVPDALRQYELPPPDKDQLVLDCDADLPFRLILQFMHAAPIAGFGAAFRSIIGPSELSVFFVGPTGCRKTALALLIQQLFGAKFGRKSIPAGWNDTPNALVAKASIVCDALMIIDDYAPGVSSGDIQAMSRKADTFLRSRSNVTGRARATATGGLREGQRPLATPLCTGEDLPQGESLLSRFVCCEIAKDAIPLDVLTTHQEAADEGRYAHSMACYIEWVADIKSSPEKTPLLEKYADYLTEEIDKHHPKLHGRQREMMMDILQGWLCYFRFLEESCGVSASYWHGIFQTIFGKIDQLFEEHRATLEDADPVALFASYLCDALRMGRAYLVNPDKNQPLESCQNPQYWGYRTEPYYIDKPLSNSVDDDDDDDDDSWEPEKVKRLRYSSQGEHIGWMKRGKIYLCPSVTFAVIRAMSARVGKSFPLDIGQLAKRLAAANIIVRRGGKGRINKRLMVDGKLNYVWQIYPDALDSFLEFGEFPEQVEVDKCMCNFLDNGPCERADCEYLEA